MQDGQAHEQRAIRAYPARGRSRWTTNFWMIRCRTQHSTGREARPTPRAAPMYARCTPQFPIISYHNAVTWIACRSRSSRDVVLSTTIQIARSPGQGAGRTSALRAAPARRCSPAVINSI